MRKLNPEHTTGIIHMLNNAPYFKLLSIIVQDIGQGYAVMTSEVSEKHFTPFGGIHGGAYASMLDSAAYWAAYASVDEDAGMTSLDLSVNMLAPAKAGQLFIRGDLLRAGRTICLTEASIYNSERRLLAHAVSKIMVVPGMQTIQQAAQFSGLQDIPPKFIR